MKLKIEPFVRYISKTSYYINDFVIARDCRIIYIISGSGIFECKNIRYSLSPGTLLYYPYGVEYKFSSDNEMLLYTINFDFDCLNTHLHVMTPSFVSEHKNDSEIKSIPENLNDHFNDVIYIQNAMKTKDLLDSIYVESLENNDAYCEIQSSLLRCIIIYIYRNQFLIPEVSPLVSSIKHLINDHPEVNNNFVAKQLGYHPYYLNEIFKKHEGITLHQYIIGQRLSKAYELITSSRLPISEIASVCGFCSQSYFTTSFTSRFNITPTLLRKQI